MGTLTRDDYISRVSAKVAGGNAELKISDVVRCLPSDEAMARKRESLEAFQLDPDAGHDGLLIVVDLAEAKSLLGHCGFNTHNWHYDRIVGCVLVNLQRGRHEALSAALYRAYVDGSDSLSREDCAEKFIEDGLGWFRSAASIGRLLIGHNVRMTAQERAVFEQFPQQRTRA